MTEFMHADFLIMIIIASLSDSALKCAEWKSLERNRTQFKEYNMQTYSLKPKNNVYT